MCKVYTGYCGGTSEIEHGLCACTVDNPLAKARGLSLRTGAQTMLYLSLKCTRNTRGNTTTFATFGVDQASFCLYTVLQLRVMAVCKSIYYCMHLLTQSGPQDQKSVIFSYSFISLNQLLKNSLNTANIFLNFRHHVKIFLSQNIMHNF